MQVRVMIWSLQSVCPMPAAATCLHAPGLEIADRDEKACRAGEEGRAGDGGGGVVSGGQVPPAAALLHAPGLLHPAEGGGAPCEGPPRHCPAGGNPCLPGEGSAHRQAPALPDGQAPQCCGHPEGEHLWKIIANQVKCLPKVLVFDVC